MSEEDARGAAAAATPRLRQRMTQDERRRQLLGIGLKMLTERPIQDVALDEVAAEAGISRGLLFHYFPTKTAYYEAVVAAAGRRILRNVTPGPELEAREAVRDLVTRLVAQIARRHELYSALVHGNLADLGGVEVAGSLRERLTEIVLGAMTQEAASDEPRAGRGTRPGPGAPVSAPVVHAWLAYVEDLAVQGTRPPVRSQFDESAVVEHALQALDALSALTAPTPRQAEIIITTKE